MDIIKFDNYGYLYENVNNSQNIFYEMIQINIAIAAYHPKDEHENGKMNPILFYKMTKSSNSCS